MELAVIFELSHILHPSTMMFEEVERSENISSKSHTFGNVQNRFEQLSSNVADVSKKMDTQPQEQAAGMGKEIRRINKSRIKKSIYTKVQAALT